MKSHPNSLSEQDLAASEEVGPGPKLWLLHLGSSCMLKFPRTGEVKEADKLPDIHQKPGTPPDGTKAPGA